MSTLGERLKEAMASAKMRQSELARASGVSESAISRFKTGLRGAEIEHDTLTKLARALDVSPEWLRDGVGSREVKVETPGSANLEAVLRRFQWPDGLEVSAMDRIVAYARAEAFSDGRDRPESVWDARLRQLSREEQGKSKRIEHIDHDDPIEARKRARKATRS